MQQDYKTEMRAMTEGLAVWCARRKRRGHIATVAVATSIVAVSFLIPHRSDTFVSGDLQCCTAGACQRVDQMIAKI